MHYNVIYNTLLAFAFGSATFLRRLAFVLFSSTHSSSLSSSTSESAEIRRFRDGFTGRL